MARYSKTLTPAAMAAFLAALEGGALVEAAAEAAGVALSSLYCRRERDPAFAAAWDGGGGGERAGRCWSGTRPGDASRSSAAGACASRASASSASSIISPAAATSPPRRRRPGVSADAVYEHLRPTPPSPKASRRRSRSAIPCSRPRRCARCARRRRNTGSIAEARRRGDGARASTSACNCCASGSGATARSGARHVGHGHSKEMELRGRLRGAREAARVFGLRRARREGAGGG